ncbi:MAG: PepSY-associated TM helix domain-containing protein [Pseudomonadota bacterium]
MKLNRLIRKVHYWLSLAIALPLSIMIVAGLLLMVKKHIGWVQPATRSVEMRFQPPDIPVSELFETIQKNPDSPINDWTELDRVDIHVQKGVAKFISKSNWEVQINPYTKEILSVSYRRSDLIESLHDGSFFSNPVKYFVFLPTGIALLVMLGTGLYLFIVPLARPPRASAQTQ